MCHIVSVLSLHSQDREERAVKAAPPMITSPHTHVTSTVSPQESIQEEPEPEVIGAGLPLLQRLKLLKAKEDKISKEASSKVIIEIPSKAFGQFQSVMGMHLVQIFLSFTKFN